MRLQKPTIVRQADRPAPASFTLLPWRQIGWFALAGVAGCLLPVNGQAQPKLRSSPYLPFGSPDQAKYTLKWGPLKGRLEGTLQTEFNDNINLAHRNGESDISFGPNVTLGFTWQITKDQSLEFDIGGGYKWFLNHPSISSISIAPNSRLAHRFFIQDFVFDLHDQFSIQTDPTSLGTLNGTNGALIDFQRVANIAGISVSWEPLKGMTLHGGYDFTLDRSLTGQFKDLDKNSHSFSSSISYALTPRWTVGLQGTYGITEYVLPVQNNGNSWSTGPFFTYRPSSFTSISASVVYINSSFDRSGSLADTSSAGTLAYTLTINNILNKHNEHYLQAARSIADGYGSNYTDSYTAQYGLRTRLNAKTTWQNTIGYEHLSSSIVGGEVANRILLYSGITREVSDHVRVGLSYTYSMKDSSLATGGYAQNRVLLEFTRHF